MNEPSLCLDEVSLHLKGKVLLAPLSLTIAPGEVVALLGESGVGKSSLLSYLCGTLAPAFDGFGRVLMDGIDLATLPPENRRLGILFQDDLLFPHLSVAQNLAFALAPRVRSRQERRERIDASLADAGLAGFGNRDPGTLSGGQRGRVAVVRVLLAEPRALLLDEPFSKLDEATRQLFREFVFEHLRRKRLPTLLVTHDLEDVQASGGRMIRVPSRRQVGDDMGG